MSTYIKKCSLLGVSLAAVLATSGAYAMSETEVNNGATLADVAGMFSNADAVATGGDVITGDLTGYTDPVGGGSNDVDMFVIGANVGAISITLTSPDPIGITFIPTLWLFDGSHNLIASDNDESDGIAINTTLSSFGTYYFSIQAKNNLPMLDALNPLTDDNWIGFAPTLWNGGSFGSGSYVLNVSAQAVPVPAAAWLFGTGVLGLAGLARRLPSTRTTT